MKNDSIVAIEKPRLHYGFTIVACCCLMMGINVGLTFSCAGIFYRPVSESLGVAVGEFGIYMSVMYVTSSLMLSVAGRLLERYSARWLFSANSALMGLTFLSMALYDKVWEFYVAGGVLGVTLAFLLYLSFPTLVNRWFQTRVGLMIGICSAASGIGGMLFNPVAGWMITVWGWRWAYAGFGVLILCVVSPLLAWLLRDRPADKGLLPYGADAVVTTAAEGRGAGSGMTYGAAVKSPLFYALILFAFLMMGISTLNLFIPGFVTDHGFSLEQASVTAAAVMAGVTIGKLALGWINDRSSLAGVAVTTLGGALGLAVLIFSEGSLFSVMGGAFLFGWAYAGVTVQTAMLTRSVFGTRDYARIYSVISIALAAGGALASGGWGLLADATSGTVIFASGAIGLILCLLLGIWSLRSRSSSGA
ncbi:MAG: MFS transporter [Muribaculaceae bacterium]|nr:MFS transporter [Muribaculaceae bacterium]